MTPKRLRLPVDETERIAVASSWPPRDVRRTESACRRRRKRRSSRSAALQSGGSRTAEPYSHWFEVQWSPIAGSIRGPDRHRRGRKSQRMAFVRKRSGVREQQGGARLGGGGLEQPCQVRSY